MNGMSSAGMVTRVRIGRERFLSTERLRVERRGADNVESAVIPQHR